MWIIMVAYVLNFDNSIPKIIYIQVMFIFWKLDVGWFYHFGWYVRILFSDYNQTFNFLLNLGRLVDENLIVS